MLMPKRIIPLSDIKVRKAKPQGSMSSLPMAVVYILMVTPSGGKLWRFKYRYDSKQKLLLLAHTLK